MTPDELLSTLQARGHEAEMRYLNGAGKRVYHSSLRRPFGAIDCGVKALR